jgi:protein arginine kinase
VSDIDDLTKQEAEWLGGGGPMSEVVISSRIRLARNVAGFPFLSKCDESQRREVEQILRKKAEALDIGKRMFYVDIEQADDLDRRVLVERHLISRQHADGEGSRGVIISRGETLAMMVNEEDHLRIQVLRSGMQLQDAWSEISRVDDLLEDSLDYAFHSRFGYLTACPTNVGTGIRVSVMMHLPALKLTGQLEQVFQAARDMRLAVRGLYGEGTEAVGDFYQVSNQTTLGKSEDQIISEFERIIPNVIQYEQHAREKLMKEKAMVLDDKIWRAYGMLEYARSVSSEETMFLLSHLRMGVNLGRIDRLNIRTVNDLLLTTQPGHLQKLFNQRLEDERRDEVRAEYIRERLSGPSDN